MSEDLVPLSPISFLEGAATNYGDKISIIYHHNVRFSWRQTHERCVKLASALVNLGISHNDMNFLAILFLGVNPLYQLSSLMYKELQQLP
ncbi:hypothetical protein JHK87_030320 [Glycine soja]|nr:hypothetical protein JHK87_030320 [Glycine soja]